MYSYDLPFRVVGTAMVFVVVVAMLRGPLKPLVPICGSPAYKFCYERKVD